MNRGPRAKDKLVKVREMDREGQRLRGQGATYHRALMLSYGSQGQTSGGRVEPIRSREGEGAEDIEPASSSFCPGSAQRGHSVHLQPQYLGAHEKCFNFFQNQEKK